MPITSINSRVAIENDADSLFRRVEQKFPLTIGDEKWYIVTLAALVGGGEPEFASNLYAYLVQKPQFSSPESRRLLVRRLRETLFKCVSVTGVCKPLEAVFAINHVERHEDKDFTFSREHWTNDEENRKRAFAWQDRIYRHNQIELDNVLDAHKDFDWLSKNIIYGLYLSDHTILSDVDTELVVFTAILIQNLPRETRWHLRGMRRVGVSMEDTETIHQCIESIAEFVGTRLDRVPRVADIECEV